MAQRISRITMSTLILPEADERAGLPSMSSIARTLRCPGWWNLSRQVEEIQLPEKSYTKDGTLGHDVLAGEADEEELDGHEDVAFAVERCRTELDRITDSLGFTQPDLVLTEERIFMHDEDGEPVASGKMDKVLIKGNIALIPDYKLGRKEVLQPAYNPQLIAYSVLVREEYGIEGSYLAIIPAWRRTPPPAHIDATGMDSWRRTILDGLRESRRPSAPRNAGPHCDYCPARAICPQAHAVVAQVSTYSEFDTLTAEQELQRYDLCKHAESTIKVYLEYQKARLEADPDAIPGLRLKPGSEQVTVKDAAGVYSILTPSLGHDKVMSCAKLSLTGLASVSTGGKSNTKKLSKEGELKKAELKSQLANHISVTTKKGSIERL